MSQSSQRSFESRTYKYINPSYVGSSEFDSVTQDSSSTITLAYPKFRAMFREAAKTADWRRSTTKNRRDIKIINNDYQHLRIKGGDEISQICKYKPPASLTTKCKGKSLGLNFSPPNANVTLIDVKLSESKTKFVKFQCQEVQPKIMRIKTRGTQTLYRESSAQTLPYLPSASYDEFNNLDNLELFKLPTILPGDGPPGLYEVEVLERARKRWAFTKALKENFRRQLVESNEDVTQRQKRRVMEAFEWEHWMEREEHIQECQMLRLEIVIRMFERREKQMHEGSKTKIELSHIKIAAKREEGLRRNEMEYQRHIRRLEMNKRNLTRNWRKENITEQLGSPGSEFFAPQKRYGVNPNRRHFVIDRKAYESDMVELERKAVNTKDLICPFAKLTKWSKPRRRRAEIEQNFFTDTNLQKLYEDLKHLREESERQKRTPKCLKEKLKHVNVIPEIEEFSETESSSLTTTEEDKLPDEERKANELEEFRNQIEKDQRRSKKLLQEHRADELEAMLIEYEGGTLGWLMKFLSAELVRLQEQRNLQFLTILAKKERWRREAAEAGLRQKENHMRHIYETLYQQTNNVTKEICSEYFDTIRDIDLADLGEEKAVNNITQLAKLIDCDIQRWLDSLKEVQNPLNYKMLRYLLRDIIFPNVEVLIKRYECELVVESIIYDVLFPHVYKLLEPYDASFCVTNEIVDRLIDTDLYLFSDDSSVSSSGENTLQEREARAILRKLIRQGVPGRRWMTPTERFGSVCVSDLLDTIFDRIKIENEQAPKDYRNSFVLTRQTSFLDLTYREHTDSYEYTDSDSDKTTTLIDSVDFAPYGDKADIFTTRMLQSASSHNNLILSKRYQKQNLGMMITDTTSDDSTSSKEIDPEIYTTTTEDIKQFLKDVIEEVIRSIMLYREDNNEVKFFMREEFEDDSGDGPKEALKAILRKVFESIAPSEFNAWEESSDLNDDYDMAEENEEEEFKIYVKESEIEMLNVLRCKCQSEKEREQYIRNMLLQGRVRVVRKPRLREEEEESTLTDLSITTFEYDDQIDADQIGEATATATASSTLGIVELKNSVEVVAETMESEEPIIEQVKHPKAVRGVVGFSQIIEEVDDIGNTTTHPITVEATESEADVEIEIATTENVVEVEVPIVKALLVEAPIAEMGTQESAVNAFAESKTELTVQDLSSDDEE